MNRFIRCFIEQLSRVDRKYMEDKLGKVFYGSWEAIRIVNSIGTVTIFSKPLRCTKVADTSLPRKGSPF